MIRPAPLFVALALILAPSFARAAEPCVPPGPTASTVTTLAAAVGTPAAPDPDTDGDGVPDSKDAFPNNHREQKDSDGDGVGDVSDAFPRDPKESRDSDCDGTGDNADKKFDGTGACSNVDYRWSDGTYGGVSRFELRTRPDGTMAATIRIRLTGERDATREADWEKTTEQMFSREGLALDVQFVSDAATAHSSMNVAKGNGRANAAQVYTSDDGLTIAHEIGHHLGLPDEYADAADPARVIGPEDSIMRAVWGKVKAYKGQIDFIKSLFKCP